MALKARDSGPGISLWLVIFCVCLVNMRIKISDTICKWRFDESFIIFKFIKTKSQILVSCRNVCENLVAYIVERREWYWNSFALIESDWIVVEVHISLFSDSAIIALYCSPTPFSTRNSSTLLLEDTCVTPTIRETKIFRNNLPFLRNVVGNFNV